MDHCSSTPASLLLIPPHPVCVSFQKTILTTFLPSYFHVRLKLFKVPSFTFGLKSSVLNTLYKAMHNLASTYLAPLLPSLLSLYVILQHRASFYFLIPPYSVFLKALTHIFPLSWNILQSSSLVHSRLLQKTSMLADSLS